ncbi:phage tail assembly protein [Exiguobacterium antarcticum]|uniref:Phage tail assembly protein n=1 Tax=Exiguobacterium antarcticum TaxID=132920 RepID=A0ABT6QZR4_9BACL|nr:phage tail assembly protein [Exiguobacterium antarcticum]MDI3234174.1 phage tail assembly protein [Exiguobacterium antarcticum]
MKETNTQEVLVDATQEPIEKKEGVIVFKKPYVFEGTTFTHIDLSGIDELTGEDLLEADRVFTAGGNMAAIPELSMGYAFAIAANVLKQPTQFFDKLPAKEAILVKNTVITFLNA